MGRGGRGGGGGRRGTGRHSSRRPARQGARLRRGGGRHGRGGILGLVIAIGLVVAVVCAGLGTQVIVRGRRGVDGRMADHEVSVEAQGDDASDGASDAAGADADSGDRQAADDQTGEPATSSEADSELASAVRNAVDPLVQGAGGTVEVAFVPLDVANAACYVNADDQMQSASMIKLVILAEYLREEDAGLLSGDETYTLKASDIVGGTGSLQGRGAGYTCTLDELARLMICQSDNVATNVLIDRMGMDAINAEAASLGLSSTTLQRRMMDTDAMAQGLDNYTTARDLAQVLALIGRGELVSQDASTQALDWLEQQEDRSAIPAGLPAGTTVGNKTGSVDAARHDGAIVLGDRPYVLVVMTDGMGATVADVTISRISSAVWDVAS